MIDYIYLEKYCKNLKVLYVEDDKYSAKKVKELLDEIFPNVVLAKNGDEALKLFLDYKRDTDCFYDLVITDIKMPKLDGISLSKKILEQNKKQEIIIISAHSETNYFLELINLGISNFILKPIDYNDFINMVYKITKSIYESKNINSTKPTSIKLGEDLYWDLQFKVLVNNHKEVKLTKKEFLLINLLLSVKNKTFSNEEILNKIWLDNETTSNVTNLKNTISRLRKKVISLNIENIYGFGYKITQD
ncbi:CheY-P-specific phosphatase CheX [Malaciobacter pacificus]|uniref:Signal transduction response regulator, OmpR family n=1 Tax=Malaciobacter pacificus TaxID=1080223 RepID=A0A5C2H9X5_9BACT|nr:response regulator transcription factor [Malaciobacter pacificus]QEP34295.1 signal transduction response regulator, OmpR family [Malaciobacter pacificus]GGD45962.1 CheY-P-specific phosphatase CheX [Malaciobacter pacificus]